MFAFRNVNNWPNPVMGNSWGSLVDCNYWSPQQRQVPKLRRYNNRCYNLDDFHWMSNDSIVWSIHMWKTNEMMSWGVMPILNFHLHWISKLFFSRLWSIQDWICLSFVSNSRHLSLFNFLVKFWRTWEEIKSVFVFCRRDKILPKLCIHLKTDLILESDVRANSKLS